MVPENLKYTDQHEWVRVEGDTAVVGITDYAQGELGDIVYVELPLVGSSTAVKKAFGVVEAVKTVSDLYAPVSGQVTAVNEGLATDAVVVNKSPYDEGWMIKIKMSNPSDVDSLLSPAEYKKLIGKE
ncbi:MAG: glycine cleavage system protein GcvH [Candidatus Eisenbacteria bacterium]|nr:glycine cleavage system protein GcvH [Candidatus Eisenbacteria bacterium]